MELCSATSEKNSTYVHGGGEKRFLCSSGMLVYCFGNANKYMNEGFAQEGAWWFLEAASCLQIMP